MKIADILTTAGVIPALPDLDKERVIEALAGAATRCCREIDHALLVRAIQDRERRVSTGLDDGVAFPHARLSQLSRTVAVFARSETGVDFDSLDGKPTHFFLLLVAPADAPGAYLKTLARASRLFSDAEFRGRLLRANEDQLFELIRAQEDRPQRDAHAA